MAEIWKQYEETRELELKLREKLFKIKREVVNFLRKELATIDKDFLELEVSHFSERGICIVVRCSRQHHEEIKKRLIELNTEITGTWSTGIGIVVPWETVEMITVLY